jgi:TatD DNase family protein
MKIFETHAHLDLKDFDKDRARVIEQSRKNGLEYLINIGYNQETSENAIKLASEYDFIFASVGYHPHDATEFDSKLIRRLAQESKVVAIGEIGLDYYRNLSPKKIQKQVFAQQIEIAKDLNLPIIVHDRDAHQDCYDILKEHNAKQVIFHCFSGDVVFAEQVLQEGWKISITGTITFKNNHSLRDVVRILPEDSFFIETDSPYLAPVPHRGKRNAPYYLPLVIEAIAKERMESPNRVAETTFNNAVKFFFTDKIKIK